MSSTASELNALGTITAIDLYKRNHEGKKERSEKHYVNASKWFTLLWGVVAIIFANFGSLVDNLIQLVNIIGSVFYGNVLGIFLLAFFFKMIRGHAVFWAAVITQIIIIYIYYQYIYVEEMIGYLWLNFIGCALVIFIAFLLQAFAKNKDTTTLNT